MRKIIASIAAVVLALSSVQAQDLAQITEIYNTGAASLTSGDKETALKAFEQAYSLATALGDEGKEVADNCKGVIPDLYLSIAKGLVNSADYSGAIAKINQAIEVATKFGNADIVSEAKELLPKVLMQNAGTLLNAKKYTEAAEIYQQVFDADPTNGTAALRLGLALNGAGQADKAKEILTKASELGQESAASKQLYNIFLKEAASALKTKNFAQAAESAVSAIQYNESAQAYQIAGQAYQMLGKASEAIKYFDKYLELAPNAKNATQIAFTIGALYQQLKNNSKAVEYFEKAVSDPTYGAQAKKLIEALK